MNKTEMVRARIEPDVKHDAEEILKELGISSSQAIGMFYKGIIYNNGIPFDVKIPNQETQEAMLDILMKRNLKKYNSVDDLMKKYL